MVDPLTARFWPPAVGPAGFEAITGHAWTALRWLSIVWTFAAFGEEISYRGYLTTRAADVGGRSKPAYWISMLLVSALFGIGHHYKGPAGMKRWVGLGVIADTLINIGVHLEAAAVSAEVERGLGSGI